MDLSHFCIWVKMPTLQKVGQNIRSLFALLSHGSFEGVASFWRDQFVVFGPITLFLLIFSLHRLGQEAQYNRLHLFIWPVLVIMTCLAFLNEANANWAVAAYPAAAPLVGQMIANSRSGFIAVLGQNSFTGQFVAYGCVLAVAICIRQPWPTCT